MSSRKLQFASAVFVATVIAIFSGCAGVHYDKLDPKDGKISAKNYGIPFYEAKPFILVQYHIDGKGRRTATPSLISLPDKTKPYKARVKGCLGHASVTVNLSNGVLVSTIADFKTDDTLAGLMGAVGSAAKVPAEIKGLEAAAEAAKMAKATGVQPNCQGRVTGKWWSLMGQARKLINDIRNNDQTDTQLLLKMDILNTMDVWRDNLCNNEDANFLKDEKNEVERILSFQSSIKKFQKSANEINKKVVRYSRLLGCSETVEDPCRTLQEAKAHIDLIIEEFEKYLPQETELPPFELYEILYDKNSGDFLGIEKRFPVAD